MNTEADFQQLDADGNVVGYASIVSVNRKLNIVVLDNGDSMPVTNYFDMMGDDCEPDEAVACVAGSDDLGWYTLDMRSIKSPTLN